MNSTVVSHTLYVHYSQAQEGDGWESYTLKAKEAARLAVTFKEPTLQKQKEMFPDVCRSLAGRK